MSVLARIDDWMTKWFGPGWTADAAICLSACSLLAFIGVVLWLEQVP